MFARNRTKGTRRVLVPNSVPIVRDSHNKRIACRKPKRRIVCILLGLGHHGLNIHRLIALLRRAIIGALTRLNVRTRPQTSTPNICIKRGGVYSLNLHVQHNYSFRNLTLGIGVSLSPFLHVGPYKCTKVRVTGVSR